MNDQSCREKEEYHNKHNVRSAHMILRVINYRYFFNINVLAYH